jgi:N-acylglucosamine-6-phosphate 2-epimerase
MSMPNLMLVAALARRLPNQVIAEGRIWTPEQAQEALRLGALAVVVGTAITRPVEIVKRFVRSM